MSGPAAVVLWDIDGTLLTAPGVGLRAFALAAGRAIGLDASGVRVELAGRTDPAIAASLLAGLGHGPDAVPAVLAELAGAYADLAADLAATTQLLPGAAALVEALHERSVPQTVVTGNVRAGAEAKLAAAGRFVPPLVPDWGGFGSDHHERAELVRISLTRLRSAGIEAPPRRCWVIGDTPHDLAAAQAVGVRCVLVATGRHPRDELEGLGAEAVLDDLADTPSVLHVLGHG